jgi:methionine-rich copper-binding protein CopC
MSKVRLFPLLLGALLALWLGGSIAYAHAELRTSSPAIGEVFRLNRPTHIRLGFSQEVLVEQSRITLINDQFAPQPIGDLQQDPSDLTTVYVDMPDLATGNYTVDWQTLSVDNHSIQGSYAFTIAPREPLIAAIVTPLLLIGAGVWLWVSRRRGVPT